MRKEFAHALADLADKDDRIILLTANLGYGVLDEYRERHSDRFIDVGVAEQAMIGAATGLAKEGFRPWCYSISTFAILRPLEFIRNGPVYHDLPVKIVGSGGFKDYATAGFTHWPLLSVEAACDAIGLTMIEHVAGDPKLLMGRWVDQWHDEAHPLYIQLGK